MNLSWSKRKPLSNRLQGDKYKLAAMSNAVFLNMMDQFNKFNLSLPTHQLTEVISRFQGFAYANSEYVSHIPVTLTEDHICVILYGKQHKVAMCRNGKILSFIPSVKRHYDVVIRPIIEELFLCVQKQTS